MKNRLLSAGLAVLSLGAAVLPGLADDAAPLTSPDGAETPRGEARLGGDEIRVRGDELPLAAGVEVWIEGVGGVLLRAFALSTDEGGSFDVRASVREGLPLGARSVSDFAGRQVQVRRFPGVALLRGRFPGVPPPRPPAEAAFRRGDSNGDGTEDISDAIVIVAYAFLGGPAPRCLDAADANDDGEVDIADPIFLIDVLFRGTARLPPPSPVCGTDTTPDPLDCEVGRACLTE
ncbi:MAG: hypothetical protein HY721_32155 [Planctomycetes bacterium]|nr:hypothetical protein [Planctomycetota bacterium]